MHAGVQLLANGEWPAMSPDMNPIEHLWPIVNRYMTDHIFQSKDDLFSALDCAFRCVTKEEVQALTGSIVRRLTAVITARGSHTKY